MIRTAIYDGVLNGNPLTKRLCVLVRSIMVKIDADALCSMKVHGRAVTMPLSHALPIYLKEFPFYDRLPGRLAQFIREKLRVIRCIDVGANVGDTIAALKEPFVSEKRATVDTFLAIEPNPRFRKCLTSNWGNDERVTILPYICSSSDGDTSACISESNGTASIDFSGEVAGDHDGGFAKRTIDSIVSQYKDIGEFNLLKIDTDGHDFEVLAGAKEFIANSLPFLYFEVDAFSNPRFVDECLGTLEFLHTAGYGKLFIYDNFGSLMGLFETSDIRSVKRLLFYKLTKERYYFDFLLMKDCFVEEFYRLETEYFASALRSAEILSLTA